MPQEEDAAEQVLDNPNESWARLNADPLLWMKREEMAKVKSITSNPYHMLQMKERIKAAKAAKKAAKRDKKEKKSKSRKEKRRCVTSAWRVNGHHSRSDSSHTCAGPHRDLHPRSNAPV